MKKETKKEYAKVDKVKLRKFHRREATLRRAKIMTRELWRVLQKVD